MSKHALGLLAAILIAVLPSVAAPEPSTEPSTERQAELLHRLRHDCGSCHGLTLKGGLGPPLLPVRLAARDADLLAAVILDGIPGTPMPPWAFEIGRDEALWLVHRLQEGLDDAAQ